MFDVKENLKNLPDKPGVYMHKDQFGEIIYVGKAASLKKRVRQYFQSYRNMDAKVRAMVSHIAEFEYIITNTEMEALILENSLIKKYMPQYNVLLRDDKTYPYIKITMAEEYPRLLKTRIIENDGSKYFGPYADVRSVNQMIDLLNDVYRLKRCATMRFPEGHRPCLNQHINRCRAVCVGGEDKESYLEAIEGITGFLSGKNKAVTDYLKKKMEDAAENMDFESAAIYRDYIHAAESIIEKQHVVLLSGGDIDIVLASKGESGAHVVVFFVRDGRLSGKESHHLHAGEEDDKKSIVKAFLEQYYIGQSVIPKEILLEEEPEDISLIAEWLSSIRGSSVHIHVPERGNKRALLQMAQKDIEGMARILDEKAKSQKERNETISSALHELLGCPGEYSGHIWRVEAYDISNTGGTDSVGGMVVFEGTKPQKKDYRRFKIRTVEGADDYSSMQEVIYRRIKRAQANDPGFSNMPDLMLIDGGLGHVHAVMQILSAVKAEVRIAGMVKDDKHRTRGLVFVDGSEITLKDNPTLFHYIGTIQEEVHRFSVDYHRGLRKKSAIKSELDEISGVGEKRRNALLLHFGSINKIREASVEELSKVPGMTAGAAEKVHEHFANNN